MNFYIFKGSKILIMQNLLCSLSINERLLSYLSLRLPFLPLPPLLRMTDRRVEDVIFKKISTLASKDSSSQMTSEDLKSLPGNSKKLMETKIQRCEPRKSQN